jgi:uncharacterized membrane protein YozB (DUF420 family)
MRGEDLPAVNAFLNATAALLLVLGYAAIRGRRVTVHKTCMVAALLVSALFLASYLYYHIAVRHGAPTRFASRVPADTPGWVFTLYYVLLTTHTLLAVPTAPLALVTAYLGWRERFGRHVRLARWTLPVWLYVSVTGVFVYWMLYRLYPLP